MQYVYVNKYGVPQLFNSLLTAQGCAQADHIVTLDDCAEWIAQSDGTHSLHVRGVFTALARIYEVEAQ